MRSDFQRNDSCGEAESDLCHWDESSSSGAGILWLCNNEKRNFSGYGSDDDQLIEFILGAEISGIRGVQHEKSNIACIDSICLSLTGCTNALKDGTGYLEDGNYKEAVTAFQKAVDEGKKTAEAYRGLGMAYYEQEDYASAKDAFEKALAAGERRIRSFIIFSEFAG